MHGTVFGERSAAVAEVREGDELLLVPGPPLEPEPGVWVHRKNGDLLGHLPPEIERWMSPWMLRGGFASAKVARVCGTEVPSWRRLVIEVTCGA